MTFFHASLDVKRCQFVLLMLNFTVITQRSLLKGVSVTFQDKVGCKEGDVIVRSVADFEVPDVRVCLPSFKMFRLFLLIKLKT